VENGALIYQAKRNDERVTRVGRLLRVTSIDELPQLVNVLRGEMSLVGPRPHALAHDDEYGGRLGNMRSDIMSNPELRVGLRSMAFGEKLPNLI